MPAPLQAGLESLSGLDLPAVRVHKNSAQPAQLDALAFAQGNEIHLGPGQERHLAHEGWHVVQQRQGRVRATTQMQGSAVNDDAGLESEADAMGAKALAVAAASPTHEACSQLKCASCEHEDKPRQFKAVLQLYTECSESTHYTDRYHHWIQNRFKHRFNRGSAEYSVRGANNRWMFMDIVAETDEEVYEIKSVNQGAARAVEQAQWYVDFLNGPHGCHGNWTLGNSSIGAAWVTEGGGERLRAWSPRNGAILYSIEQIDLTSSESDDSGMDTD